MTNYKSYVFYSQCDRTYSEILETTVPSLRYFQRILHVHLEDGNYAKVYAVHGDKEVFVGLYYGHNNWVRV